MLSCLKRINKRLDSFKGLFFFILIQITSYALEVGNIIHSDSASYLAIKELGKGDFGEVWMIEDVESHERYALKFFFNSPSQSTLNTYDLIPHLQSLEQLPHVLKTYAREYYTIFDTQGTEQIEGIRFQAAISNVEKLYEDHFSLINTFNTEVQKKRILEAHELIKNILDGILGLKKARLNHHDLNPRNILKTAHGYVISDLDEIRKHGVSPSEQAWEGNYAPIEYEDIDFNYNNDNLSDVFQLASTVYKLFFGESYLQMRMKKESKTKDIWNFRKSLNKQFQKHHSDTLHSSFFSQIKEQFTSLFFISNPIDQDKANDVINFLEAALELEQTKRRAKLNNLNFMRSFDFAHKNEIALIKESENVNDFLEIVIPALDSLKGDYHFLNYFISEILPFFIKLNPSPKKWKILKSHCNEYIGPLIKLMKAQPYNNSLSEFLNVINPLVDSPVEKLNRDIDDELIVPAIKGGIIRSVRGAVKLRKRAFQESTLNLILESGLKFVRRAKDFLILVPHKRVDVDEKYIQTLKFFLSRHIDYFLSLKPSSHLIWQIDPDFFTNEALSKVYTYLRNCSGPLTEH